MTVEKIRELCYAEPFHPFVLHLPDGRHVRVGHPDYIAFFPTGRLMVVTYDDESQTVIDSMLVSDVTIESRARRNTKAR